MSDTVIFEKENSSLAGTPPKLKGKEPRHTLSRVSSKNNLSDTSHIKPHHAPQNSNATSDIVHITESKSQIKPSVFTFGDESVSEFIDAKQTTFVQ